MEEITPSWSGPSQSFKPRQNRGVCSPQGSTVISTLDALGLLDGLSLHLNIDSGLPLKTIGEAVDGTAIARFHLLTIRPQRPFLAAGPAGEPSKSAAMGLNRIR